MRGHRMVAQVRKLLRHPTPGRLVASRVLWHTGVSQRIVFDLPGGVRLRFNPSSISAALWTNPKGRSEDVEFLVAMLRSGDTYVDCGANIGQLALVACKRVGGEGRVTAIEANPRIFSYLVDNLALNRVLDVRVVHCALGERDGGVLRISDRRDDDQNHVGRSGVEVAVRTLDSVVPLEQVTLLKIDVEGFELNVLRGASHVLKRTDVVYCELSASNCARYGYEPSAVERELKNAGFELLALRARRFERRPEGVFGTLGLRDIPATGYNLVAVRTGFIPEFASRVSQHGLTVESANL